MFEVLVLDVGEQFFFLFAFCIVGLFLVFSPFCSKKTKQLAEDFKKEKKRVNILAQKDPRKVFPTQRELFWFAQTAVRHNKASP